MKTKEEILKEQGLQVGFKSTYSWDAILGAMDEYASQFQQEWIPVEVRLPEIEEFVMLLDCWKTTDKKEDRVDMRIGYLQSFTTTKSSAGLQYSCEWAGTEYAFNITHWRPLPPLPQPYNPKQL